MKKKLLGFLVLIIAWIIIIPLVNWTVNLPHSFYYGFIAATLLFLLIIATVSYPLLLIWKNYRNRIKDNFQDGFDHIKKIDKISLLLALIISIILTLLFLSTYSSSEGGVTRSGIIPLIQDLFKSGNNMASFFGLYGSMLWFCFELIVSYFIISILMMRKKVKTIV